MMGNIESFERISLGRKRWNAWRASDSGHTPDLRGFLFNQLNLAGYNFTNCQLDLAYFKKCVLTNSTFDSVSVNHTTYEECGKFDLSIVQEETEYLSLFKCDVNLHLSNNTLHHLAITGGHLSGFWDNVEIFDARIIGSRIEDLFITSSHLNDFQL